MRLNEREGSRTYTPVLWLQASRILHLPRLRKPHAP
jgi:hypothetical protein